jgi:glycosyltransferase involved in cell wall biosynthesis
MPTVLFIQNRTHRAGAQTCLARLLRTSQIRERRPVLVCSPGGWLVEEATRHGAIVVEERFVRSRSVLSRLYANAAFARRVVRKLKARGIRPAIVQANDHAEGLLGLEIAKLVGARSAMFLRSPTMGRDDYFKYRCQDYDFVSAVGDDIRDRAQSWDRNREIALIHDGIFAEELEPAKPKPASAPQRVLVIGSPIDWKGWADLTEALFLLEQKQVIPAMQFDFTGVRPERRENDLKLERLKTARCTFLGRVEKFRDLVVSYDLAINPSRMETFGMAAIEVLAAGVPLLSSRTGVMEQVQEADEMLFAPAKPDQLASALKRLLEEWSKLDLGVARSQENIRRRFQIDRTVDPLIAAYDRLLSVKS